jgi:FemAB-related protein (PEP-CTERM system-associated)
MKVALAENGSAWNAFVFAQPQATAFHQFGWAAALKKAAGHKSYFLSAEENGEIKGVLPLCLMEGRLFGRFLVSLPHYLGSVCAVTEEAAEALVNQACALAEELKADSLELRGNTALPAAEKRGLALDQHKASFKIDLTAGEEVIWKNLKKQVRNRIRKGDKAGLTLDRGHHLLNEFWEIFSLNMRAIGSPTFSRQFFGAVLEEFAENAELLVARQDGRPAAAKLLLGFRDTLTMLWGAAAPKAKLEGANYWLTWQALRYALSRNYAVLDMGRSTVDSGPYQYKSYWGGSELRHCWYLYQRARAMKDLRAESPRFRLARKVWRNLPLSLTRAAGPWIARQIP